MKQKKTMLIALAVAVLALAFTACPPEPNPDHIHSYSTTWSSNATQHWHECSCGDKIDIANHSDNPCTICNYNDLTHTHLYSTTWSKDTTQHWRECNCGDKADIDAHTGDPCTTCGYSSGAHTHDSGEWITILEPTCIETGSKELRCTVCGAVLNTGTIDALGHDWSNWTQDPTQTGIETRKCTHDPTHTAIRFTTVAAVGTWLVAQEVNTPETAYTIVLNVSDLGGDYMTNGSVGYVLDTYYTKYVYLDLSGSTITSIDSNAFRQRPGLTGIEIPNSVTSIGSSAFRECKLSCFSAHQQ
jgi:hypothetical protein